MTTSLYTFGVKNEAQIRDDFLRTYSNGLILQCGIPNPNVLPGSDAYVLATALGLELAPIYANCQVLGNQVMPDTATGAFLARIGALMGLSPRPASGASGFIVHNASATGLVPTGAQLTDSAGLRYQVTSGNTYATGAFIPVAAVDTGSATNHAAGDSLRWQSSPPYSAATALVANGGLTNGTDVELDASFRQRIATLMSNPAGAGTSTFLINLAALAHPSVQSACAYPAYAGPSTALVACFGFSAWNTSAASASRVLNTTVVQNIIQGFVQGNVPEHVAVSVVSTTDQPTDVAFALSLPSSTSASPPGPGGGWLDGTPWPTNSTGSSSFKCSVTAVTNSTSFAVDSPTSPTAGATHIAFLSPTTWQVYSATVLSYTQPSGTVGIIVFSGGVNTISALTGMAAWMVGHTITISNANTSANNGDFVIASFISSTTVTVANASGATDSHNGAIVWSVANAYSVTVDAPFTGIAVGNYIWPQSVNQQAYVTAIMNQFGLMGPGETTANPITLQRAFRHPTQTTSFPYSLNAVMLRAIQDAGTEVLAASYLYANQLTPSVGATPQILVPRQIGIYSA